MVRRRALTVESDSLSGAEAALPSVPEAVIEEVAREVAGLVRSSELRCAFEVGRLVVARFFGGDLAGLHRRGPKEVALSRLAEQLRLHGIQGRSVLDTCLATYETLLPMGDLVTSRDLSPSHVRAVFPLPQPERESLLRLAAERGWSVREVRQAALRAPRRMLSARPSRHEYERRVHDLARAAQDLIRVVSDRSAMAGIEADVHARAFGEFARTLAALERALHRATPKRTAEGGPQ